MFDDSPSSESADSFGIRKDFEETLNRHGYAFQYSVLRQAQEAFDSRRISRWRFEAAEVPVRTQARDTRIDFVLSRHRTDSRIHWYLICECKRVNPSRGNWCFLRPPFIHRKRHSGFQGLLIECVERFDGKIQASAHPANMVDAYGLGLAIRSKEKGDKVGKPDNDAIEDACAQVLTGVNGFANTLEATPFLMPSDGEQSVAVLLVPVIFTTATLWVADVDISSASASNGNIDLSAGGFTQAAWLWFAYHTSPGLRHSLGRRTFPATLPQLMDDDYIRHIAIVNSAGIDQFLRWSSDTDSFL